MFRGGYSRDFLFSFHLGIVVFEKLDFVGAVKWLLIPMEGSTQSYFYLYMILI